MPPRKKRDAGKRPDIEAWLTDNGVDWRYAPAEDLDTVDIERSLQNQARVFEPIDEAVVKQYTEGVLKGDPFPAIVVHQPTPRRGAKTEPKRIAIDGNHRLAAHREANVEQIDMYIVENAKQSIVIKLAMEANVRHGKPTSFDERVHQAIWLVDSGMSKGEAAGLMQIRESELNKAWNRILSDRRADEVGIARHEWERITQSSRNRLASVVTDEGMKAAASLAARAALDANEVFEMVGQMNTARSSNKQVAIAHELEKGYKDRIQSAASGGSMTNRRARTPKTVLNIVLGQLATLPDDMSLVVSRFVPDERVEAAERVRAAGDRLHKLAEELESV